MLNFAGKLIKWLFLSAGAVFLLMIAYMEIYSAYISMAFTQSRLRGTWLSEDGDPKTYGRLELLITQDSVYYGDNVLGDGHRKPYYRIKADSVLSALTEDNCKLGASMQVRNDTLFLIYPKRQYNQSWLIRKVNASRFDLQGDSYTRTFVKVADNKIAGHF